MSSVRWIGGVGGVGVGMLFFFLFSKLGKGSEAAISKMD